MTSPRRAFAPSLRRATSAPSARRTLVLTLLYLNAIVSGLLGVILVAYALLDFLQLDVPLGTRLTKVAVLAAWTLINVWVGKQVFEGSRKGYHYGLVLFGLLLAQEVLVGPITALAIGIAILSVGALASIRDELVR